MLVYNKYLKELGYKRNEFPFEEKDGRYKLMKKYGVVEAQTWSLYNTIILELYTYLRFFQECCPKGIPGPFIDDSKPDDGLADFQKVVQEIIDGLKAYIELENLEYSPDIEATKKKQKELEKKFEKGWGLLGKYLGCFWW